MPAPAPATASAPDPTPRRPGLRLIRPAQAAPPAPEPAATLVFERLLARAYQKQGFQVVELPLDADGSGHSDGAEEMLGTDLLLARGTERVLVSCRHWRAVRVGVEAVTALRGRMSRLGVPRGCLVTASRFTLEAWALSHVQGIRLVDGDALHELLLDVLPKLPLDPEPGSPGDGDGGGGTDGHPPSPLHDKGDAVLVHAEAEHFDPSEPDPRLPPLLPSSGPSPAPAPAPARRLRPLTPAAPAAPRPPVATPPAAPRPAPWPAPVHGVAAAARAQLPPLFSDLARGMAPLAARQPTLPGLEHDTPSCPRCGRPMVLRQLRRGDPRSPSFWGCTGFPSCGERRLVA